MFPKVDFCLDIPTNCLLPTICSTICCIIQMKHSSVKKGKRREPSPRTDLKYVAASLCCMGNLEQVTWKILKYSFIGLAGFVPALLCGGYYMLGHALNPEWTDYTLPQQPGFLRIHVRAISRAEAVGGQPADGRWSCATSVDKEWPEWNPACAGL